MIEEQALSRIHRLGQTRNVTMIRYRVRGSFEEVRFCPISGQIASLMSAMRTTLN